MKKTFTINSNMKKINDLITVNKKIVTVFYLLLFLVSISNSYSQLPVFVTNTDGVTKTEKAGSQIFFFKTVDSSGVYIQELWTLGANISSAVKIKSFGEINNPYGVTTLTKEVNGKLYFVIGNSTLGEQLWISDGTINGTTALFATSKIYAFFDFNNTLYFSAFSYTDPNINGMYKTDGTLVGTSLIKNIQSRYNGTFLYEGIYYYTKFNNNIVFVVHKGVINNPTTHYVEIWSTDGTTTGFVKLDSLYGAIDVYENNTFPEYNSNLYFRFLNKANNNTSEVWRTNGTANNASYFHTLGISSQISPILVYNNKLILGALESNTGFELYTTDGTVPGTALLKDINASPSFLGSNPNSFNISCNKLFFSAKDSGNTARRIWETDGTTNGTVVKTAPRGTYSLSKLANGALYYSYINNNYDSVKVYMMDSSNCNSTLILSWSYADYGYVSQMIQLNPLFVSLSGGLLGAQGLYALDVLSTSISEKQQESTSVNIYPNPATNKITVNSLEKTTAIEIYNVFGEIVYQSNNESTSVEVDFTTQPKGVYSVKVYTETQFFNKKIVVQ